MRRFKYLIYTCYTAGLCFAEVAAQRGQIVKLVSHCNNIFKERYEKAFRDDIFYFSHIEEAALYQTIKKFHPDFIVSCVFDKKIPNSHIQFAQQEAVNIHPSRLPQIRTADSLFWNILLESNTFQLTMHRLTQQWDAGDILYTSVLPLHPLETRTSMILKVEQYMSSHAQHFQHVLEQKNYHAMAQDLGAYYPKLKNKVVTLMLDEDPIYIERLIRACQGEFTVQVLFQDHPLQLLEVQLTDFISSDSPGVLQVKNNKLYLNTVSKQLRLTVLDWHGYSVMSAERFIDIVKPKRGEKLIPMGHDRSIYDLYLLAVS